jgi:hypothetical protein
MTRLPATEADQVPRLEAFKAAHPEFDIMTPLDTRSPFWKCYLNGGQVAVESRLKYFLDALEWLAEE